MFSGEQSAVNPTAWRAKQPDLGEEYSETHDEGEDPQTKEHGPSSTDSGKSNDQPKNRGKGSVAGPSGNKDAGDARKYKETKKATKANHNRREQRAKKIAKGGY